MATVYKIKIETVSAFVNYPENEIEKILTKFFKEYEHPESRMGFEGTKINVERK